jgi:tripartite-type tricarboxylate transporter receptor subunit TctC
VLRWLLCYATAVAASLIELSLPALAEAPSSFPSKPITLIVPFQARVSADLLFRGIADSACCSMGRAAKSGLTRRR